MFTHFVRSFEDSRAQECTGFGGLEEQGPEIRDNPFQRYRRTIAGCRILRGLQGYPLLVRKLFVFGFCASV